MKVLTGDFNGDGRADIMKFDVGSSSQLSDLSVGLARDLAASLRGLRWELPCTGGRRPSFFPHGENSAIDGFSPPAPPEDPSAPVCSAVA